MASMFETGNKAFDYGFPSIILSLFCLFIIFEFFRPTAPLYHKWRFRMSRIVVLLSLAFLKGFQTMVRHFAFAASWNINTEQEGKEMSNLLFGYNMHLPIILNMFFIAFGCFLFGVASKFVQVRWYKWLLMICVTGQFASTFLMAYLIQRDKDYLLVYILHVAISLVNGLFEGLTQVCIYKCSVMWYEHKREYGVLSAYIGTELLFELWFGLQINTVVYGLTHKVETMLYSSAVLLMLSILGITMLKIRPEIVDDSKYYLYMADRYLRWKSQQKMGVVPESEVLRLHDEDIVSAPVENAEGFVKMAGNEDGEIEAPHTLQTSSVPSTPAPTDDYHFSHHADFPDLYSKELADERSNHLYDVLGNPQLWILCAACFVNGAVRDQTRANIVRVNTYSEGVWVALSLQSLSLVGFVTIITALILHIFVFSRRSSGPLFNPSSALFVTSVLALIGRVVFLFVAPHYYFVGALGLMMSFGGRILIDCALSFCIFHMAGGYKYIGLCAGMLWGAVYMGVASNVFFVDVVGAKLPILVDEIIYVLCDVALVGIFFVSFLVNCYTSNKKRSRARVPLSNESVTGADILLRNVGDHPEEEVTAE